MVKNKPILGITMGDPAGIGPEIAAKALADKYIYDICRPLVVGDAGVMTEAVKIANVNLAIRPISRVDEAKFEYGVMDVIDLKNVDLSRLEYGKVSAMAGNAAFEAVRKVIELAMDGEIDGTVTGPINKEAINLAGHHFAGHTEIYAHFTKTRDYTMMLAYGDLRVVHVSTHVSLRKACDLVKKERVLKVIKLAYDACRKLGFENPKIGVAGLNPHSGEGGLFGDEEEKEIIPAIEEARRMQIDAEGPVPPDTLFPRVIGRKYHIAVAMYHDQGHIPVKTAGFKWDEKKQEWQSIEGVNVTLGLPIIRTSVDHGTAFDKAGKGIATPESLICAVEYGAKLAAENKTADE